MSYAYEPILNSTGNSVEDLNNRLKFLNTYGEFQKCKFQSVIEEIRSRKDKLEESSFELLKIRELNQDHQQSIDNILSKISQQRNQLNTLLDDTLKDYNTLSKELVEFITAEKKQTELVKILQTVSLVEETDVFLEMTRERLTRLSENTTKYLAALNGARKELASITSQGALEAGVQ